MFLSQRDLDTAGTDKWYWIGTLIPTLSLGRGPKFSR